MNKLLIAVVVSFCVATAQAAEWFRGGADGTKMRWGIDGGLQFAIHPSGSGPRGLVRVYSPTLEGGKYDLVNFIAIEPVVDGKRGLSELEHSDLDRMQGKRFWVDTNEIAGTVETREEVEVLRVVVNVEPFLNGAKVKLLIEQRADRPEEMGMTIVAAEGCAVMKQCILTATMGNRARTRLVWLKNEAISSKALYADYRGPDFAPTRAFPLSKIVINRDGDLLAAITTDEERPADVRPFPGSNLWYWGGRKVTQYWRKPRGSWDESIEVAVNGRFTYWMSKQPIPGGVAFENFELREDFAPDRQYIFGVTEKTPAEMGMHDSPSK